jgi:hypothetical protein
MRIQNPQLVAAKVSKLEFRGKEGNSPDISMGFFQLGMCEFDPSQVSQPQSGNWRLCTYKSEKWPPIAAFCRFVLRLWTPNLDNLSAKSSIVSG